MRAWTVTVPPAFAERHPGRTIAAIGVLFALAYAASLVLLAKPNGQIVLGDAVEHYVQLRSVIFDGDLQFVNDYAGLYRVDAGAVETAARLNGEITETGHVRNYMPVGPAILWAPLFLATVAAVWGFNLVGGHYPLDGFARLFQATAGLTGIAAAAAGVWLAFRSAAILVNARVAIWATLTVWLASSSVYYSVISPAYSHAASMLAAGAFWYVWLNGVRGPGQRGDGGVRGATTTLEAMAPAHYALLGVLVGFAALMRWQDAVLLAVPGLSAVAGAARETRNVAAILRRAILRIAACVAAAALTFLPQMIVWSVLYGQPLTVPQGPGFMRWNDPALAAVLISDNHGLLTWTPIIFVALVGLVLFIRRDALVGTAVLLVFVFTWVVNAAVADWWAGEAFGARRFISCFPLFVLGVGTIFERLRPRTIFVTASAFVAYTFLLLVHYQVFMHRLLPGVPYPRGFVDLWLARFRVFFELLVSIASR